MGSVKFGKDSEMYLMFGDYYRLIQTIWEVETNDKYWQNVIQDMRIFKEKYKNEYAVDLVVALSNELTRKEKQLLPKNEVTMEDRADRKSAPFSYK